MKQIEHEGSNLIVNPGPPLARARQPREVQYRPMLPDLPAWTGKLGIALLLCWFAALAVVIGFGYAKAQSASPLADARRLAGEGE